MLRTLLRPLSFLFLAHMTAAAPAAALDIDLIDMFWLQDRFHGTPVGLDSYGVEFVVELTDNSNFTGIELQAPGGGSAQSMVQADLLGLEWELEDSYVSSTDLFNAYNQTGTYTFTFLDGAATVDTYSITLNAGDLNEVTDYFDITDPAPFGNFPVNGSIDWTCTLCDGTSGELDIETLTTFMEVDGTTVAPASGSWSPSGLVAGEDYAGEAILADYHLDGMTQTTGLDDFEILLGYESINNFDFTAVPVPEPGSGTLVGGGLVALALRRRARRQR